MVQESMALSILAGKYKVETHLIKGDGGLKTFSDYTDGTLCAVGSRVRSPSWYGRDRTCRSSIPANRGYLPRTDCNSPALDHPGQTGT